MLETEAVPRSDEVGGAKDRADVEALRAVAEPTTHAAVVTGTATRDDVRPGSQRTERKVSSDEP